MKKIIKNLPLILLISAIALSPSFSAGKFGGGKVIELRIEDILIVILGLIWLANLLVSGKSKIEKPPLFFPILVWLGIGFISVLTNFIFQNLQLDRGFFYFLKEIEFFVFYFYIFYHIKNIDSAKFLVKLWILLGAINVAFVIYQILFRASGGKGFLATIYYGFITKLGLRAGEYGAGAIGEWGVFPSGAFFLIIFIFLINVFLYYYLNLNISKTKKWIFGITAMGPALGVFGSASKTNFLGFIFALFLTLFLLFLRKRNLKLVLVTALIMISAAIFLLFSLYMPVVERLLPVLSPSYALSNYIFGRLNFWLPLLEETLEHSLPSLLMGAGKGYVGEAHNQFLRNLIETGIIGSLAFLFLIFIIIKIALKNYSKAKDPFSISLSAGLFIATLTMLFFSLATDPFIVVKLSSVYWVFVAITMAVLTLKKPIPFKNEQKY